MKALIAVLFCITTAAFGQSLGPSAGYWGGYTFETLYYEVATVPVTQSVRMSQQYAELGLFYDGVYFEASGALLLQLGPQANQTPDASSGGSGPRSGNLDSRFVNIDARLLGKYPIRLAPGLWWFPAAGVEYSWNVSSNEKQPFLRDSELSDLFLDVGAGVDVALGGSGYLRLEGIAGLNLTPTSQGAKDSASQQHGTYSDSGYRLTASLGFGWRL